MFYDTEKRQYRKRGFCIVDDAVDPDMLKPLLEAAIRTKKKVRSGEVDLYTHRSEDGEPWAIRGLFSPRNERANFRRISNVGTHNEIRACILRHTATIGRRTHLHKSISSGLRFWFGTGILGVKNATDRIR